MIHSDLERCQALLSEGYAFWNSLGYPPLSEDEREEIPRLVLSCTKTSHGVSLAAACQSFFLFRTLHNQTIQGEASSILLGDYFFGIFSQSLIPLDSTWLIDQFAVFLREDTEEGVGGNYAFDLEQYKAFVKAISSQLTA